MKLLLKVFFLLASLAILINSCKKTSLLDENGNLTNESEFNTINIKTWYYKTFVTSADALQAKPTDVKYPVWKNGIYYKISNFEVFEFPMIKNNKEIEIPSNMSEADKKRVAESSLTRIRFIKDKVGKISVIEVNYIPELQYLQKNNYDISNTAMGKQGSDFTGRMILKKWSGEQIAKYIFKDGKATGKIKKQSLVAVARGNNASSNFGEVECSEGQQAWCTYHQHCDVYGDGMEVCGDWEVVDCWCEGEPADPCEDISDEACLCQQTGICDGGDDGDEDEPEAAIFNFENVFAVKISGSTGSNEDWSVTQPVTINGMKFPSTPANNYYTTFDQACNCIVENNNQPGGGLNGYIHSFVYCKLNGFPPCQTQSNLTGGNKIFTNTSSATVFYPNYHNNNGQLAPYYVPYSKTKQANAYSDL